MQVPKRVLDVCYSLNQQLCTSGGPDIHQWPAALCDITRQLDSQMCNLLTVLMSALLGLPHASSVVSSVRGLDASVQQQLTAPQVLELLTALLRRMSVACAELPAAAAATAAAVAAAACC